MINKTELRIGNYVLVTADDNTYAHYSQVVAIAHDEVRVSNDGLEDIGMGCDWDGIEGIPLTAELLEECGFEKINEKQYQLTTMKGGNDYMDTLFYNKIIINKVNNNSGLWYYDRAFFKHLHQLQNLYSVLTSEELQIKPLTTFSTNKH